MLHLNTKSHRELREYLDTVPVIETHEHYVRGGNPSEGKEYNAMFGYYASDLLSGSLGMQKEAVELFEGETLTFDRRFEIFEKLYRRSNKTAYARAWEKGLEVCWGIKGITKASFKEFEEKYSNYSPDNYETLMNRFGIKAKVVDIHVVDDFKNILEGKDTDPLSRFAFPLPSFHNINTFTDMALVSKYLDRTITCLDDFLEGFENLLKKAIDFGVVCIKDQSAYRRIIRYNLPSKAEAEKVFNRILMQPRSLQGFEEIMGTDELNPLDDWLFHHYMRLARKYRLPVQIHTGHMAGIRNDITKANASHFIPVLELHADVAFDLFHGNWPYMDEYLFIGKNYPNAYLDLCWVQSIDPLYSIELMKRALVTVPHSKIMAFGGDTRYIELCIGYLILARDNVACALSEMVDSGWMDMQEAKEVAVDWFFNNPNEFFNVGFEQQPN